MSLISVTEAQQGLTEAARTETIPGPGRIDGDWGPRTQASLDAFLSTPFIDYHGEVEVLIDASPPALEMQTRIVRKLKSFAALYRARPQSVAVPGGSLPAVRPTSVPIPAAAALSPADGSGPRAATMAFAVILGLGAIGGLVWWASKGRR